MQGNFGMQSQEKMPEMTIEGAGEALKQAVAAETAPEGSQEQTATVQTVEAASAAVETVPTLEAASPTVDKKISDNADEVKEFEREYRAPEPDFSPAEEQLAKTLNEGGYLVGVREKLSTNPDEGSGWLQTAREWLTRKVNAIMSRE